MSPLRSHTSLSFGNFTNLTLLYKAPPFSLSYRFLASVYASPSKQTIIFFFAFEYSFSQRLSVKNFPNKQIELFKKKLSKTPSTRYMSFLQSIRLSLKIKKSFDASGFLYFNLLRGFQDLDTKKFSSPFLLYDGTIILPAYSPSIHNPILLTDLYKYKNVKESNFFFQHTFDETIENM